ncbi:MAG: transglycosylase SLT domain-containing protein [Bacteroidaceae bacterium]|nr:transglycosylase SLT domain-containing protein [Bacteroidaceae bacterium]
MKRIIYIILTSLLAIALAVAFIFVSKTYFKQSKEEPKVINSPFGTILYADADTISKLQITNDVDYDLPDIVECGEVIVLTVENKETFYELNKRALGVEYLLAESFARHEGLFVRGELCRDTIDMIEKLHAGVGDIIAVPLPEAMIREKNLKLVAAGATKDTHDGLYSWAVRENSPKLKQALDRWFTPNLRNRAKSEEQMLVMTGGARRHYIAPIFDREHGKISVYDHLFKKYSDVCGWDWRLLAAQCYQESMFDPEAQSFAGARGLMQIMPGTAKDLGLPLKQIFDPEQNISAATRLIRQLSNDLRDIPGSTNRMKFVLASYNGGIRHIRDAQALARADNMKRFNNWESLTPYILQLEDPEVYSNDSIVQCGYMRGSETVGYVSNIFRRWNEYKHISPAR